MCKTMQVIVDREREDAEVAKGKRIALNLWKNGEHDLDKIAQTTELSLDRCGRQLPNRVLHKKTSPKHPSQPCEGCFLSIC